jgi:3-oxoacyl-[acyl-carrier protein] reductase
MTAQSSSFGPVLSGKTAIITGSGKNIGKAIALELARQGANIVVNGSSDRAAIEAVAAEIGAAGVGAMSCLADVGKPNEVRRMVDATVAMFGSADIAISNVSLRMHRPFLEITDEDWHRSLATNLSSAFYLARACLPHMIAKEWGRIINISGRDGFVPAAARAANVVSKGGVHALSKAIAVEFGRRGVTANTVAPGVVDTVRDPKNYPDLARTMETRLGATAVGYAGSVDDIASACAYLCSPAGSYITGQVLHVSGGEFMC